MRTKIFLDTEFTGLTQDTSLISIGLVSEYGKSFYGETYDYKKDQVDGWIQENVIDKLQFRDKVSDGDDAAGGAVVPLWRNDDLDRDFKCASLTSWMIRSQLRLWLLQFDEVEIWSDCLAYDWVLFCDLFEGAMNIPANVHYIPFDLATAFKLKGVDPDINREKYAFGEVYTEMLAQKHTALYDAQVIKKCYEKLMKS